MNQDKDSSLASETEACVSAAESSSSDAGFIASCWTHLAGWPLAAGALTAVIGLAGTWAVGRVSSAEAVTLLESMFPTTRFLCTAVMTGSATILALMLTLLGLTQNANGRLKADFFQRVRLIALLDALSFTGATLLLMFHSIPIQETDNVPDSWYRFMYYGLIGASSAISGLLATIVLSLYNTVRDLIGVVGHLKDSPLLVEEE